MAQPLTPTERRVYHYLIDFLAENTYQPSVREIGKKFRIKSTKTVSERFISLAIRCIRSGARSSASEMTASGLPSSGVSVKTSVIA